MQQVILSVIFLHGTDITSSASKPSDALQPQSRMSRTASYTQIITQTQEKRNSYISKFDCRNFLNSDDEQINIRNIVDCNSICPNIKMPRLQMFPEQDEQNENEDEVQFSASNKNKVAAISFRENTNNKEIRKKYAALEQQVQSCFRNKLMIEFHDELEMRTNREIIKAQQNNVTTQVLIANYYQAKTAAYINMHKKLKKL